MSSSTIATTTFKEDIENFNFTLDEDEENDENSELSMIESSFRHLEEKILKVIGSGEEEDGAAAGVMKGSQQAAKRESIRGRSEVDRRAVATGRM